VADLSTCAECYVHRVCRLELLMRILIMDYINILLTRNAFPTTFGLKEAFQVLR